MLTIPKPMDPLQIALAIAPPAAEWTRPAHVGAARLGFINPTG
jgi:hypothetical protein